MSELSVTFLEPRYLLLLILLIPAALIYGLRTMWRLPAPVRRTAIVIRLISLTLVVLAISQPILGRLSSSLSVTFAVDVSDSISPDGRSQALEWIEKATTYRRSNDQVGLITYGKTALFVAPISREWKRLETLDLSGPGKVNGARTNGAEAIDLALSAFPPDGGKRIVVLSDGNDNGPAINKIAQSAAARNIQVSTVAIQAPLVQEIWIEAIEAPQFVRDGEQYDVSVLVRSTLPSSGVLRLWQNDRIIGESNIEVRDGANRFGTTLTASQQGFHSFGARIDVPIDTFAENNLGYGFTVVKDQGQVLIIAPDGVDAKPVQSALNLAGAKVEVQPPSFIPSKLSLMKKYDAMVLLNVPAKALAYDQAQTVVHFAGGLGRGLMVVGGEESFSLGNYAESPLAAALPVAMSVPGKIEKGTLGLILVIDKSGSMDTSEGGVQKMAMAREAAIKTTDVLTGVDVLGVLAFDTEVRWIVLPDQIGTGQSLERIRQKISTIEASGGTEIHNALANAYNTALRLPARFKHIILFSDGRSLTESDYTDLMRRMGEAKITLSTIAIGSDSDLQLMERLAKEGNGRYYFSKDAKEVPQITTRETRIASGSAAVEGQFQPVVVSASPILKAIRPSDLPKLDGYVVTTLKPNAQLAIASDRADPILAHWQFGLGRVAVWTSDLQPKWAKGWLNWNEFQRFWSQAVRWTMRSPADPNLNVSSSVDDLTVTLTADLLNDEGLFMDLQDVRVMIPQDNDSPLQLPMNQVRPGRYAATIQAERPGAYSFQVAQYQDGKPIKKESSGFVVPTPAEYRYFGTDMERLVRVAEAGGGRLLTDPKEAFGRDAVFEGRERIELWYVLLLIAALLFPLDVAVRRLKLSPDSIPKGLAPAVVRVRRLLNRSQ